MSGVFAIVIVGMGLGRVALGLAPFVAAGATSRLLGFPPAHDTPTARLMARLFGVRDIGLGVLAFYACAHPETAAFIFVFNAFMDAGDLFSASIPIVKRQGITRGALSSAACAAIGGTCWVVAWALLPG